MKIYLLLVLFFLTINQSNAQTVRLSKNKIPTTNISLKKENTLILTLTALIEGMYVPGNNAMTTTPSVTVELHDGTSLALVESQTATLNTEGVGTFTFTTATNGSPYYIVVKYINTVETWSANAVSFSDGALSYDFTTDVSKAYGNNLKLKGGKWCIYSGDINQDGYVNLSDYNQINNDSYNLVSGAVITDLTGDLYTNLSDYNIVNNNSYNLVSKVVPTEAPPTSLSYGGQIYHIVLIGTQYWLRENMNIGTRIDGGLDQTDPNSIEKYCYYDDTDNCAIYGGLYQWGEAIQYDTAHAGVRGICPDGWHIPTLNDLNTLVATVDSNSNALKAINQGTEDGTGTNASGFSALLSGYRIDFGLFLAQGNYAGFWSSTHISNEYGIIVNYLYLEDYTNKTTQDVINPYYGFAVRCIKN